MSTLDVIHIEFFWGYVEFLSSFTKLLVSLYFSLFF